MAQTDTVTRNAVQELLELPVAWKPLTVKVELPSGYKVKVQALLDRLDALSENERKRLYQGTWGHTQFPLPARYTPRVERAAYTGLRPCGIYCLSSTICMPSRNRLPWL